MSVKLKICGLTNLTDAKVVSQAGADWLGFIFAASPRQVKPEVVKNISSKLEPGIKTVGVFANRPLSQVQKIAQNCGLDYIQLHGEESPDYCQKLARPVIKSFRVQDKSYLEQLSNYNVDYYLLDTYVPDKLGGTGKTFNWELATAAQEYGNILIAGGLEAGNIKQAIEVVNPFGVDVGSGVEAKPGAKDHKQVKELVNKVKKGVV